MPKQVLTVTVHANRPKTLAEATAQLSLVQELAENDAVSYSKVTVTEEDKYTLAYDWTVQV
jgi:hypothetical protein